VDLVLGIRLKVDGEGLIGSDVAVVVTSSDFPEELSDSFASNARLILVKSTFAPTFMFVK